MFQEVSLYTIAHSAKGLVLHKKERKDIYRTITPNLLHTCTHFYKGSRCIFEITGFPYSVLYNTRHNSPHSLFYTFWSKAFAQIFSATCMQPITHMSYMRQPHRENWKIMLCKI